ncbi:MAG: copper resistance system multicopper oxidase [Steroidobacteraceae bacterium]
MKGEILLPQAATRRRFVQGLAGGGLVGSLGMWPRGAAADNAAELVIGETAVNFTGRQRSAITVNGSLPAPLLRWREGSTVEVRVRNALPADAVHGAVTSLHWHGLLLPANMDGVPGMSFDGIRRGETFVYRFALRQAGTYWYHSHSGFQEQAGLYGPLIVDAAEPEPFAYDREHVVLLSDWTDLAPDALFARLKKMAGHDNYSRQTVGDFIRDAGTAGLRATLAERRMWGAMRMTPTDLSDVNANTYTYLMNGRTAPGNWTGLFRPGEKLRLRFINGSAMTYFDVRIPGLKMTVVAADGQYVHPVTVEEFRIAAAETFDVIVEPAGQDAFTIFAQDSARTGYVRGTLAVRDGLAAPVPPLDARPLLTMADMGMAHGAGGHEHMAMPMPSHPPSEQHNPLVDNQAMAPMSRLDDPGAGLRDNGRDVLSYGRLHSLFADPDGREPGREVELHLTGHMEKFAWSFDGIKFAGAAPLRLSYGERLRIVLVNDTMMSHPIHLHGMWSDLEDDQGEFMLRKHTVDMPPGSRRSYRVRADALGNWAYHCHLLYHMQAGMMRHVLVEEAR